MSFDDTVDAIGTGLEAVGVAIVVVGTLVALGRFGRELLARATDAYGRARTRIGRAILLGLELLVAGDIVRTVATEPNFRSVGVLAAIVLIRTFLSFTLETEISGWPPWRRREPAPE